MKTLHKFAMFIFALAGAFENLLGTTNATSGLPPDCSYRLDVRVARCPTQQNAIRCVISNAAPTPLFLNRVSLENPSFFGSYYSYHADRLPRGRAYGVSSPPETTRWWRHRGMSGRWTAREVARLPPCSATSFCVSIESEIPQIQSFVSKCRKTHEKEFGPIQSEGLELAIVFDYLLLDSEEGQGREPPDVSIRTPRVVWDLEAVFPGRP